MSLTELIAQFGRQVGGSLSEGLGELPPEWFVRCLLPLYENGSAVCGRVIYSDEGDPGGYRG